MKITGKTTIGRRPFTLIEIMAVMVIAIAVMTIMIPTARKLTRGNRVDELASAIKLGLEQAQVQALARRTYVAVLFPDDRAHFTEEPWEDICMGGFRLAEVSGGAPNWTFVRWTDGAAEWHKRPDGALLTKIESSDDGTSLDNLLTKIRNNEGISSTITDLKSTYPHTGSNPGMSVISGVPNKDFDDSGSDRTCRGIVFGPYGEARIPNANLLLFVAAADKDGFKTDASFVFTEQDDDGPTNYRVLRLRKFSGKVDYVQ